jgi:hypothetical protein
MATRAPVYHDREMSIGRVLERAVSTIRHNPGVIIALALLIGVLPRIALTYIAASAGLIGAFNPGNPGSFGIVWKTILVTTLIGFVASGILQGALTRVTFADSEGRVASFGDALATGVSVLLPLIGVGMVYAICTMIGFLLFIIPGLIVITALAVAASSLVVERNGVFGAIARSRELTKGYRLKIFGLYLVIGVANLLIVWFFGLVCLKEYNTAQAGSNLTSGTILGTAVLGAIIGGIAGTVQPALYIELRHAKDGGTVGSLEEVFA